MQATHTKMAPISVIASRLRTAEMTCLLLADLSGTKHAGKMYRMSSFRHFCVHARSLDSDLCRIGWQPVMKLMGNYSYKAYERCRISLADCARTMQ